VVRGGRKERYRIRAIDCTPTIPANDFAHRSRHETISSNRTLASGPCRLRCPFGDRVIFSQFMVYGCTAGCPFHGRASPTNTALKG